MSTRRLAQEFYSSDTITVARDLLGKILVHRLHNGTLLKGRIVETEAYLGVEDPAAHSFGGRRTPRTEVMFSAPGTTYIYFIYGMYFCFNVVTAPVGHPEAVLIRALEPVLGLTELANGPGKLCRAMRLNQQHNALNLCQDGNLWIEPGAREDVDIVEGPRIGIGALHDAVHWPLRFGIRGHSSLSPAKFPP